MEPSSFEKDFLKDFKLVFLDLSLPLEVIFLLTY